MMKFGIVVGDIFQCRMMSQEYCTTTTLCVLHFICLRAGDNINIDHPCLWSHMKKQVCELELTFHPFLVTQTTASNNLQQL